jgi:hypothetical protein
MSLQKDNSTYTAKVALRQKVLHEHDAPVVLETHGGYGGIYRACYGHITQGVVLEKDPKKAAHLAEQRPTWSVWQGDSEALIAAGVGRHLLITLLDIDPYGSPWPLIAAWFASDRPHAPRLAVAVNDGLRQGVGMKQGWQYEHLRGVVEKYGNERLADNYLAACKELLASHAARAGYRLTRWAGHYTGHSQQMTHYAAIFVRSPS